VNRREAIAALIALPEVTRIAAAKVEPDDVIVVECDQLLSDSQRASIRATLETVWPGRRCVVLGRGMTLKLVPA
jgi:hypothetical protein